MPKTIVIRNAARFAVSGMIPYIGKYVPGAIRQSLLPVAVNVSDEQSGEVISCRLLSVIGFDTSIPEILSLMAEHKYPHECLGELLSRNKVKSINELGFYLYEVSQS